MKRLIWVLIGFLLADAVVIAAGGTQTANIFDALTGYRVNGAATSANYLRGDGTNFVSSAVQDSDLPSTITRDSEVNVQGTTNEISSTGSGVAPTLSIPSTFRLGGKTHTAPTTVGTAEPGTCAIGDLHFDSDATPGDNLYGCTATDTWTLLAGGGGSSTFIGLTDVPASFSGQSLKFVRVNVGETALEFTTSSSSPAESDVTFTDITTNNVTSTKHGYAPKSPADATQFLNGAATPAYAAVKDSDLSTSDVTTNNVSTTKHGFAPKAPNDATKYLDGTGAYSVPAGSGSQSGTLAGASNSQLSGGASYYVPACGVGTASSSSSNGLCCAAPITATQAVVSCHADTAPGASKTWGCAYYKGDPGSESSFTSGCQISGASAKSCTTTVTGLSITAGDRICMNLQNIAGSQNSTYFSSSITFLP